MTSFMVLVQFFITFVCVKNLTGKILSVLFLFHLLFIQGVNLASARHRPVSAVSDHYQHITTTKNFCRTVSIVCETDEKDDADKFAGKFTRIDVSQHSAKFFQNFIHALFPCNTLLPASFGQPNIHSLQGISLLKVYCSFLI